MIEKKRGKDEEINREAIWPVMMGKKKWSPKVWGLSVVVKIAWVKASKEKRKIERETENCERYTVRKRAFNEKKKRVFFYYIFKCYNLYLT